MIALAMGWSVMFSQSHLPGEFIVMFHDHQNAQKWGSEVGLSMWILIARRIHCTGCRRRRRQRKIGRCPGHCETTRVKRYIQSEVQIGRPFLMIPKSPSNGIRRRGDHDITRIGLDITTGGTAANGSQLLSLSLKVGSITTTLI